MKKTFKEFKSVAVIAVHFVDKLQTDEIEEILNDWFELYKGMTYEDPLEFLHFHLGGGDVSRDTHEFWLDEKGLMILYLNSRTV